MLGIIIGPFEFGLESVLSLLMGLLLGFAFFFLIYLYASLSGINKIVKRSTNTIKDVNRDEILVIINDAKSDFRARKKANTEKLFALVFEISKQEVLDIAIRFNPESNASHLELTIDEAFLLVHYVVNRVDKLLSGKIFHLFRGLTIRQIFELNRKKDIIIENPIVQNVKKHNVITIAKHALNFINVLNPLHWAKKVVVATATSIILDKIAIMVISIVGEEAYRIYSKKIFGSDDDIDSNIKLIYDNLFKEIDAVYKEKL